MKSKIGGRYSKYVLVVLVIFNFREPQILSILAEAIKADIGISAAEIGFLYGTAFAVFYGMFGTARSVGLLAGYRIGTGIAEARATPAAFSMLPDYCPPRMRAPASAKTSEAGAIPPSRYGRCATGR